MNYYLGEFKAAPISLNKVQEIKSHKLSKNEYDTNFNTSKVYDKSFKDWYPGKH